MLLMTLSIRDTGVASRAEPYGNWVIKVEVAVFLGPLSQAIGTGLLAPGGNTDAVAWAVPYGQRCRRKCRWSVREQQRHRHTPMYAWDTHPVKGLVSAVSTSERDCMIDFVLARATVSYNMPWLTRRW